MNREKDKHKNREHDEIEQVAREAFAGDVPPEVASNLRQELTSFRRDLPSHPYVQRLHKRKPSRFAPPFWAKRVLRTALMAATASACVVLAVILTLGPATPTWADVAERFASVEFFSATIYVRDDALAAPKQLDLWMGRGGRVRLKTGPQVIFAARGRVTKAFDVKQRKEVEPDRLALNMLRALGDTEQFSLDTVVAAFSGGQLKDVTPLLNPDAAMARDMVVFDVQNDRSAEWSRIWALKESKLPIRVQVWNPLDGGGGNVVFSYAKEQPKAFFDAEAFAKRLADRTISSRTLSYLDLTDPGGKAYAPGAPAFEKAAAVVTETLDGKPWSLADHRGKVVILHVWDGGHPSLRLYLPNLRKLHGEFEGRDDFQIVSLIVANSRESARQAARAEKVPWQCLYEAGAKWQGELARSLGTPYYSQLYLVSRQGRIGKVSIPECIELVQLEMNGLAYDTIHVMRWKLSAAVQPPRGGMTAEEMEQFAGKPDEVGDSPHGPGREQWTYVLLDKKKEQERRFSVHFNKKTRRITGWGSRHSVLDPAVLKVTVSPEYWKANVLPKIDPKYRPENDPEDRYAVYLSAATATSPRGYYSFAVRKQNRAQDYVPGETRVRAVLHGTYRIIVCVEEREGYKQLQTIVLKEGLVLEKDSRTEIVLE